MPLPTPLPDPVTMIDLAVDAVHRARVVADIASSLTCASR